jgi:hypothetical protein
MAVLMCTILSTTNRIPKRVAKAISEYRCFFKHIFGTSKITVRQQNGEDIKAEYYQLGYDYVQLLYHKPTMRLPILCLVSKENETGKSTFGDLMKAILRTMLPPFRTMIWPISLIRFGLRSF